MPMIENLYKKFQTASGVSIDSRESMDGKIFFAIKGENFDGNSFALEALVQGAIYAVVDDPSIADEQCLLVENVLVCLQELAHYHRQQFEIPIIGITGSNGKTTTKELMVSVLSQKYRVHATSGNFNNHIGVPLTLLRMPLNTEIGIIEMGANHIGEISFLCGLAAPNFGLITNIGSAHLEGFGSIEGVKKAKSELYKYLEANKGRAFVNGDDLVLMDLKPSEYLSYKDYEGFVKNGFVGIVIAQDRVLSRLIGKYNVNNIRAAVTIGAYFSLSQAALKEGVASYEPDNNRSQLILTKSNEIVMDAYNANPSSMKCSIEDFATEISKNKSKVMIIGSMKELGNYSKEAHLTLLKILDELVPAFEVHVMGTEFEELIGNFEEISWYRETKDLLEYLSNHQITNARILIKGSRSNRLEQALQYLQE